jgi:hypothetical protein
MYCSVHHQWQEMYGVDLHVASWLVPLPILWPYSPHVVGAKLKWGPWGALTGASAEHVLVDGGAEVMQRGTDIGPGVLHLFIPHVLLPGYWAFSGSKSEFAANTVHVEGKRLAIAALGFMGLNLNCAGFMCPPLPTGVVMAQTTVQAWMTLADFIAGLASMVVDSFIQHVLNRTFNQQGVQDVKNAIAGPAALAVLPDLCKSVFSRAGLKGILSEGLEGIVSPENILGLMIGSPLGMSATNLAPAGKWLNLPIPSSTPVGDDIGGMISSLHDGFADFFNSLSINDE